MRTKLKLVLERLVVDSFDTSAVHAEKGTVFGEQCTCDTVCSCPGCPTCDPSCEHTHCDQDTCQWTCGNTCGGWTCDETCEYTCRLRLCPQEA
jgi:hypothetical protein